MTIQQINNRYHLLSVLGRGGVSTVFEALDDTTGEWVAVKVLTPQSASHGAEAFIERFKREASSAVAIRHENIPRVLDFGVDDDVPFVVMEKLEGETLRSVLRRQGQLSPKRVWGWMLGVVEAISMGHAQGIVHKDIKPENLFIAKREDGREMMMVMDFGQSRWIGAPRLTDEGRLCGTPHYMSPEYIVSQEATPALDVYQLGLVLAEMLTGEAVVDDERVYPAMLRHIQGRLELSEGLLASVVGPILEKALALAPEARYGDASVLLEALRAVAPEDIVMDGAFDDPLFIEPQLAG